MPDFPANFVDDPITTEARVARYETAKAQHAALSAIVTPVSLRQPDKPVPASIVEEAQGLLADLRRLMSREPGRNALLVLREPLTWAALASRLGVAGRALEAFQTRYRGYDEEYGIRYWRTPEGFKSLFRAMDLDLESENLSPHSGAGV